MNYRTERDSLGELKVPADSYYGIQTARAIEYFPISGLRPPESLISATAVIKKAAAKATEPVRTGRTIRELVLERQLLDAHQVDDILSVEAMTRAGVPGRRKD